MNTFRHLGPSDSDGDFSTEELLEQHDPYIVALARKQVPRNITSPETLADDIDELAQNTRIRLWMSLQKGSIANPRAYIRSIVYTEAVNMVRRHKPAFQLPLDDYGELYQGRLLLSPGEGMQDPSVELEEEEMTTEFIQTTVDAVLKLPPRQQQAMICSLKDQLDNILTLVESFRDKQVDIESMHWPEEKDEAQRLYASLSIAWKKLRTLKQSYVL